MPQPRSDRLGAVRGWFRGMAPAAPAGKPKPAAAARPRPVSGPRTPINRLVAGAWSSVARAAEHVHVPVARTLAWQSPFVGVVADDVLKDTPVDRLLQPLARMQTVATGAGAMLATPVLVGYISSAACDPANGPAAIGRAQVAESLLRGMIDAQLEMFGSRTFATKVAKSAAEQAERDEQIDGLIDMIFAPLPREVIVPENPTEAQLAYAMAEQQRIAAEEQGRRDAVSALRMMPAPLPEDNRGAEAEAAAARMAAAAERAADAAMRATLPADHFAP